jgi:hypothetical protein
MILARTVAYGTRAGQREMTDRLGQASRLFITALPLEQVLTDQLSANSQSLRHMQQV